MQSTQHTVIFTDLDGTLLDLLDGSAGPVLPVLSRLQHHNIPVVFSSAKTRAEQEKLRRELNVHDPFIVENGGAVYIPRDYFPFSPSCPKTIHGYQVVELGMPYQEIRSRIVKIRETLKIQFTGFGDLTPTGIARRTGLAVPEAIKAAEREYDETLFLEEFPEEQRAKILRAVRKAGMRWTHGGRYYHVMGGNDKGRAVRQLTELYKQRWGAVYTIGIGDSRNDLEMLAAVDLPLVVEKYKGGWEDFTLPNLRKIPGKGPAGWRRAVESMVLKDV